MVCIDHSEEPYFTDFAPRLSARQANPLSRGSYRPILLGARTNIGSRPKQYRFTLRAILV